jgi:hypothetical protein
MSTVQKRHHVSGLTLAIIVINITARLHGIGKVLALDGVSAVNAVGEYPARDVNDAPYELSCLS